MSGRADVLPRPASGDTPLPDYRPDYARGYLRVPWPLWRALFCRCPLTRRQLQLVAVVLRESWGWQEAGEVRLWTRPLSSGHLARATGLSTDHLARDLERLIECGVLRSEGRRYQVVGDPRLWKTPERAPKQRPTAPKERPQSARTAPPTPVLKKERKISSKDRTSGSRRGLSPGVDNSPRTPVATPEAFLGVLAVLLPPLSTDAEAGLRRWVAAAGLEAVWQALGPVLLADSQADSASLEQVLQGWRPGRENRKRRRKRGGP